MTTENKMTPVDAARQWFSGILTSDAAKVLDAHKALVPNMGRDWNAGEILADEVRRLRAENISLRNEIDTTHACNFEELKACRAELAAMRDGFDPKVKLPDEGSTVLGQISTGYTFVCHYDGKGFRQFGAYEPVTRWWPLPSSK